MDVPQYENDEWGSFWLLSEYISKVHHEITLKRLSSNHIHEFYYTTALCLRTDPRSVFVRSILTPLHQRKGSSFDPVHTPSLIVPPLTTPFFLII